MKKNYTSRHGALMAEPVIAISFFAIISIFLLRIFASTEKIRNNADETSKAVVRAESVMEYMLAGEEAEAELEKIGFKNINANGRKYLVRYYDKNWAETDDVGKYMMTVFKESEETESGRLEKYELHVSKVNDFENSGEIYSLSTKKYLSGGGER